jgi:hypothetical protein
MPKPAEQHGGTMDEAIAPSRFHPHGWHLIRDDAVTTHLATGW